MDEKTTKEQFDALKRSIEQPLRTKAEEQAWVAQVNAQGPVATPKPIGHWIEGYDDRMRKHIRFALDYAANYEHGAPGHLDLMTIAALARHLSFALDVEPPYGP